MSLTEPASGELLVTRVTKMLKKKMSIQKIAKDNPTYNKQIGPSGEYDKMFRKTNASGSVSSSSMQPPP